MAILSNQIYDANRDVYLERERYEREMQLIRMKMEDDFHRQHPYGQALRGQMSQEQSQKPAPDPKNPLAFLNKSDNKLLLTGEAL